MNFETIKYPNMYVYLFSVIILALHPCKVSIILIDCNKLEKYKIDEKCDFIVLNKDMFEWVS